MPVRAYRSSHPRPQLERDSRSWKKLDGPWKFGFDENRSRRGPEDPFEWTHTIQVPFAPETPKSGVSDTGFHPCCWYEREVEVIPGEGPLFLHFGAVDYSAQVWVNGKFVGSHEGGHTPFSFDITSTLDGDRTIRITVRVEDDPNDLAKPRGKQDWQLEPHSIWYPRTTGLWQSVWLERLPKTYLQQLRWTPHVERWEIGVEAVVHGEQADGTELKVRLYLGERLLASDSYQVIIGEVHRRIALSDPGIDDFRNELLWSPEKPTLIRASIELWRGDACLDRVDSYTALRSVAILHDKFLLNGRPYYCRLVLDQGYWPETFLTAPDDEALRTDILLTKRMGFNGVRKHQKIEDPRYLFWADVLGLLVWEEMPSAYRFTHDSVERLQREWTEVIDRDYSHPCIVVWVPFNESWGVPDLQEKAAHRHCVQAFYHLTKTLDPTRPVVGNDGWESTATDIVGIHDYENNPERLIKRYGPGIDLAELLGKRRPAGRLLTVDGHPHLGQPVMLTEFGGIALSEKRAERKKNWGYSVASNEDDLEQRYRTLLDSIHHIELFSGFCFTQLTDTFQEVNGLLYADRRPKIPLDSIARATLGPLFAEKGVNAPMTPAPLELH